MTKVKFGFINDISISKKLWFLNVVGVLLPMFILFIYFSTQIYNEYEQRETILVDESINRISKNLNVIYGSASDITYSYLSDRKISNILNDSTYSTSYDALVSFHDIEDQIQADVNTYDYFDDITIYHQNKEIKYTGHTQYLSEEAMNPWIESFLNSSENQTLRIDYSNSNIELYFVRKLDAFYTNSRDFIEVKLNKGIMEDKLIDEFLEDHEAIVYVVDETDKIIITSAEGFAYSDTQLISNQVFNIENTIIKMNLEDDYLSENWQMVVSYNNKVLLNVYDEIISLVIITLLILVFSSLLVHYISVSISSRLELLDAAMTNTEDDNLNMVVENLGKDEIGHTASRYNEMVTNTKKLIEAVDNGRVRAHELLVEKSKAYEELESLNEEIRVQGSKIHDLIYIDSVTGLKNRFAINNRIDELIEAKSEFNNIAIMFLDIDDFKYINDTFGHEVGDKVIKATGEFLSNLETDNISVGRFGGDEFIIVLKSLNMNDELDVFLNKLQETFEEAIVIDTNKFHLSASIGVTRYPEHGTTKEDLIKKADQALNQAKESGKKQFVLYDESINIAFEQKIHLQRRIKTASVNKEFYLNYQPYISSETNEVEGFEALIRWDCIGSENVSPFELIRNAEEMGLIIEIGEWVIEEACRFIKDINARRDKSMSMSINISIVQLMYNEFYEMLIEIVNRIGVSPKDINLEITETVLLDSIEKGVTIIDQLKSYGFGISLDDFGTGYSSLSYFKKLPVTILKIDKTFIDEIVGDYYNKELIVTLVKIAHNRDVRVTAEGVENLEQLDYLRSVGVDMIQGFYYSKALSEEEAIKFLTEHKRRS